MNYISRVISSVVLALGIFATGYTIAESIRYFRNFERAVEVKGLAEQVVKSDLATWNISFSVSGESLKDLYQQISTQQKQVSQFLVDNGFAPADIQLATVSVTDNLANQYGNNSKVAHFQINNSVSVTTKDVDLVAQVSQKASELVSRGIIISSNGINYFYNNLNTIKGQMLNSATQNAKLAAATFAKNTNSQVGKIKTANQGVFSISSPDGSIIGDTSSINKKVRVVTSIQFFLN